MRGALESNIVVSVDGKAYPKNHFQMFQWSIRLLKNIPDKINICVWRQHQDEISLVEERDSQNSKTHRSDRGVVVAQKLHAAEN